ncbi:protoglobin domain-containing protein, partial [Bdellovibrionota bacterium FG-2]
MNKVTRIAKQQNTEKPRHFELAEELGIDEEELNQRKRILDFTDVDVARLVKLAPFAREYATPVIEEFYRHLLTFEEMRTFFP